jgi:hypothetical protein
MEEKSKSAVKRDLNTIVFVEWNCVAGYNLLWKTGRGLKNRNKQGKENPFFVLLLALTHFTN